MNDVHTYVEDLSTQIAFKIEKNVMCIPSARSNAQTNP